MHAAGIVTNYLYAVIIIIIRITVQCFCRTKCNDEKKTRTHFYWSAVDIIIIIIIVVAAAVAFLLPYAASANSTTPCMDLQSSTAAHPSAATTQRSTCDKRAADSERLLAYYILYYSVCVCVCVCGEKNRRRSNTMTNNNQSEWSRPLDGVTNPIENNTILYTNIILFIRIYQLVGQ